MEPCPFCHEPVAPKAQCKGRLPGPLGRVDLSPGPCKSTPETRATKNAERAARAQAIAKARESGSERYAREL
jgi:hypothetical protein